jgi:hypothetical protein
MTPAMTEIQTARTKGRIAAHVKLGEVSHEAASTFWRESSCSDTLHAYGYWDGFLAVLAETRSSYRTEMTEAGEQFTIPGCELDDERTGAKQLGLF